MLSIVVRRNLREGYTLTEELQIARGSIVPSLAVNAFKSALPSCFRARRQGRDISEIVRCS